MSLLLAFAVMALLAIPTPAGIQAYAADSAVSQKIADLDEKIAASQEKIKENEAKKKEAQQNADTIQESVDLLQSQINAYNSKIDVLNSQISTLNKDLTSTQQKIAQTEADMAVQKEQIAATQSLYADRLRAMYVTGNVSNLEILLEADNFRDFLNRLDKVIAKGVNVTLVAHANSRKFETPDTPPYDKWELKISKQVAPIVKEWADILLFMNYRVMVIEENGRSKARGKGERMMYATHRPTYDAKNRYGLPDEMPLSFEPLKEIYEGTVPPRKEANTLQVDAPEQEIYEDPAPMEDIRDVLVRRLKEKKISKKRFIDWLVETERLQKGVKLDNLSATAADEMLKNFDLLVEMIEGDK